MFLDSTVFSTVGCCSRKFCDPWNVVVGEDTSHRKLISFKQVTLAELEITWGMMIRNGDEQHMAGGRYCRSGEIVTAGGAWKLGPK